MEKQGLTPKERFYGAVFSMLFVTLLVLPKGIPREFTVENNTQKTISKVNFIYAHGNIFNEVNIPPNSSAVVKMPDPGWDVFFSRRYASTEERHAHDYYDVYIEFSDGSDGKLEDQKLTHCFKVTIQEKFGAVQAVFGDYTSWAGFIDIFNAYKSGEVKRKILDWLK